MGDQALELVEVTKCFRSHWTFRAFRAVDRLSFAVREGEIFGLIGHNGAGKTTTFKLLVGLLRPTSGSIRWEGAALDSHRRRVNVGFSPEQPYFHDYLTVRETLDYYGRLYGLGAAERRRRIAEVVERVNVGHKLDAHLRTLSKGTLQRVAVAQAILHAPRLAILDEPMSGLDPAGRKHMRELILSLKEQGATVLFSSHVLSDAEALCDRVAILAGGRVCEVVEAGDNGGEPSAFVLTVVNASAEVIERLQRIAAAVPVGNGARRSVRFESRDGVRAALAALQGTAAEVESLVPERLSLEERFLHHLPEGSHVD